MICCCLCRLNEDELLRFFTAANGDFPFFLSSIKKTIRWRETYNILQGDELEIWSNMVYWHGVDMEHQPCLIIRLGLACSSLSSHERPRFIQVIGMDFSPIESLLLDGKKSSKLVISFAYVRKILH